MERKFLQLLCSLIFCSFSFCYLYFYQEDVMTVTQHLASGGRTFYSPLLGAILITIVLKLIQQGLVGLISIPTRALALAYIPSFLLLTLISSIDSDVSAHSFSVSPWGYSVPFVIVLLMFIIYIIKRYEPYALAPRSVGFLSQNTWVNLLIILIGILTTGVFSNNDPYFHMKAKVEHLIDQRKYQEALAFIKTMSHTDSTTSMLTIYAAARTNQLNDSLFYYPLEGGADVMRPINIHSLLQPDSIILKDTRSSANYQLMSFLLKKNLVQFVRYLPHYYPVDSLRPRYYAEAFRIYSLKEKDSIPNPPYEKGSYYKYYFSK